MKRVLFILMSVVLLWDVAAQKMVYLEHCEALSFDQRRQSSGQLLRGNVRFRHDNARMYCDSAYFYERTNSFDAFGHVKFVQGDTLTATGDKMHYDGNAQLMRLQDNVVLTQRTMVLTTNVLYHNRATEQMYYTTGGTICEGQDTLTSRWGMFNSKGGVAEFRGDVHMHNDELDLRTDTLVYYTAPHIVQLIQPTTIVYKDETTILSHDGWYNSATQIGMLLSRSQILHIDGQQLTGDTIYYDRLQGIGKVFGHMELKDTHKKISLLGNYGVMYEQSKSGLATDSAYVLDWSQPNKSYIHADTIYTEPFDSAYHKVYAYHNVRAYSDDYQFVCDSMVYNSQDSLITMYREPVIWSQNNQVSSDTIFIHLNDSSIDYIRGVVSALCIKQEGEEEYDQMSGKQMLALIRQGELREIQVSGNAETVFYPRNADSTYVGVNKSQSSYVTIYLENDKVHHVLFTTATSGTLYPMEQISQPETRLIGFFWAQQERPTSFQSIFLRPARTSRPVQKAISATEDDEEEKTQTKTPTTTKRNRKEK